MASPRARALLLGLGLGLALAGCTAGEGVRGAAAPAAASEATPAGEGAAAATTTADPRPWRAPAGDDPAATRPRGPAPEVRSIAEFEALAGPLRCRRAVRCGYVAAAHYERCVADGQALAHELLGVRRGLEAGRTTFDPEAASACLQVLAEGGCHVDLLALPAGCLAGAVPSYLRPAVAPGGACERWEECVDGLCDGELGCPGVCRARTMTAGGRCDHHTLCGDALFCEDGVCKPRGGLGEPCSAHWQACAEGLRCVGAATGDDAWGGSTGTCERPRGRDQLCGRGRPGDACRPELYCDYGAEAPRCRERLPAGAPCRWLDACADGLHCAGLQLAEHAAAHGSGTRAVAQAGTCAPIGDVDAPCDPAAEQPGCASDLRCDPATRRCRDRGREGDRCRDARECAAYHSCDAQTRTCRPQVASGAPCRPGGDEFTGHCFLGTCDPRTRRCVPRCARERARERARR